MIGIGAGIGYRVKTDNAIGNLSGFGIGIGVGIRISLKNSNDMTTSIIFGAGIGNRIKTGSAIGDAIGSGIGCRNKAKICFEINFEICIQ